MNLLASYDWLKEYVSLKETPEQFAARVSLCGPGVERLYPQGQDLEGVVLGHVLEVKPHPNADKLRLATVDIGSSKLSIVCGGSNLAVDQWVAVAKIGAKVKWHGEGELVELKPAEIRGVKSDGMICSSNEIGLFDAFPCGDHEILDFRVAMPEMNAKAGTPLARLLGLEGDTVMDIEVTTNRPDAMGMVGMAREAAAILKKPFVWKATPAVRVVGQRGGRTQGSPVRPARPAELAQVAEKKLCPRYMAVKIDGVAVGSSPWWLKRRLLSAGLRPVNNVVDITNFVMLELGQPMHAFDAEKIVGGKIRVRKAKAGESFPALDGKTYEMQDGMLVIADEEKVLAVAGVMGGETSEVTTDTRSIVFEAATFDAVSVRRTARGLNLHSDAQARFEKGLSTEAPPFALARAVELCLELAGGSVASPVADVRTDRYKQLSFSIKIAEISKLIGVELPKKEMVDTLKRLGFSVTTTKEKLTAKVPWWRDHDIESGRDLVEEIARVYGYANIPAIFPAGLSTQTIDPELTWEDRLRVVAKGAGLTETFTYAFVSKDLCEKAGYDATKMLRIQNPLTSDFEFMRTTLLPSLMQVVVENQERFRSQQLFEIAHVYYPRDPEWKDLPDEQLELGAAFLGGDEAWRKAKGFAELVYRELGVKDVTWKRLEDDDFWHPGRSVQAFVGEELLGTIGEIHPTMAARFKFEGRLAMIDMPLEVVFKFATVAKRYVPLPVFPEAKRDLAVVVSADLEVEDVLNEARRSCAFLSKSEWFDTYRGKGMPEGKKSVALHLEFSLPDRTLEAKEVDEAMAKIENVLRERFEAEVRR